jgi:hypothetical protein
VTPGSYGLAHSPLTGPAAWGKLPTLLREQAHEDLATLKTLDLENGAFTKASSWSRCQGEEIRWIW